MLFSASPTIRVDRTQGIPTNWDLIASGSSFPTAVLSYPHLVPNSQRHGSHTQAGSPPTTSFRLSFLREAQVSQFSGFQFPKFCCPHFLSYKFKKKKERKPYCHFNEAQYGAEIKHKC